MTIELSAVAAKLTAGSKQWQRRADQPGESLDPPASVGLLLSVTLWRRLAVDGLQEFVDVYYQGTAPLPGRKEQVDVLVAEGSGAEMRFYFDSQQGHLLAAEMFPSDDVDPCELYFGGSQIGSRWQPQVIEVRFGNAVFETFQIEQINTRPAAPVKPGEQKNV